MKAVTTTGYAVLCAMTIGIGLAHAQTAALKPHAATNSTPATTIEYQDLLGTGYELKTVLLVAVDVSTRLAGSPQPDTVMIVLQRGRYTANCWVTLQTWYNQKLGGVPCNQLQ